MPIFFDIAMKTHKRHFVCKQSECGWIVDSVLDSVCGCLSQDKNTSKNCFAFTDPTSKNVIEEEGRKQIVIDCVVCGVK